MRSQDGWALLPTGTGATWADRNRPSAGRRRVGRIAGTAITAMLASTLLPGLPAFAATPPSDPNNILVFPNRDFVSIDGYQDKVGQLATIDVTRAGTLIARAEGPIAAGSPALEANHPGGVCWGTGAGAPNVTPDILPGDVVSVAFNGVAADSSMTQSPMVTSFAQPFANQVVVDGTLGTVFPAGAGLEQRIVNPALVGKRDVRATVGPLTRDKVGAYSSGLAVDTAAGTFTATYVFDVATEADKAAQGDKRANSWMALDAAGNRQGLTLAEFATAGGGMPGCPAGTVTPAAPTAPLIGTATAGNASALVNWREQAPGSSPITGNTVMVFDSTNAQVATQPALAGDTSVLVTGLTNGQTYRFQISATNAVGTSASSRPSNAVTPMAPISAPSAPTVSAVAGTSSAMARWTAPADGGSAITGYWVRAVNASSLAQIGRWRFVSASARSLSFTGLAGGTAVRLQVAATNAVGLGAISARSNAVTPRSTPGAPVIRIASSGVVGGAVTASASWTPPASNGGLAVNGYQVTALRMSAGGAVVRRTVSAVQLSTVRSLRMALPRGLYRFEVRARNGLGLGATSLRSNQVIAR